MNFAKFLKHLFYGTPPVAASACGSDNYEESRLCLNPAPANAGTPANAMGIKDSRWPAVFQNVDVAQIHTEILKVMEKWIIAKKVYFLNRWNRPVKRHVIYVKTWRG